MLNETICVLNDCKGLVVSMLSFVMSAHMEKKHKLYLQSFAFLCGMHIHLWCFLGPRNVLY